VTDAAERRVSHERRALVLTVFLTALAGILYELLLGTVSTLLLGDSILEWSLTIGVFLSAMGLGSFLSRWVKRRLVGTLVVVQIGLAILGGLSPLLLFWVYALAERSFRGVLVLVLVTLGTGIGLEIPVLTRLLRERGTLARALSAALAIDYAGALLASLAFPLLLYPTLGLVRTAMFAGLVNLAAGVVLLFAGSSERAGRRALGGALAGTAVVLTLGLAGASRLERAVDRHLYDDTLVWQVTSPYQRIAVTMDAGTRDLRLFINRHLQFSSRDEARYHEALVHPALAAAGEPASVLVLGGGDGLATREILEHERVRSVVVVDLDPAMTSLAQSYGPLSRLNRGALSDPRVRVVNADAMQWLWHAERGTRFGAIVIDLPDPSTPGLARLYTRELYRLAARRLTPGGVVVTQATSPYYTRGSFWCIERSMAAAGLATRPYHISVPSFGEWGFVLGGATLPRELPRPTVRTSYLEGAAWAALFAFPPDMRAPAPGRPSTVTDPALLALYTTETRREP